MLKFVDIHTHLFNQDEKMEKLFSNLGISVVSVGIDRETSHKALSSKFYGKFVGVHPSSASKEEGLEWLEKIAPLATGIGEIGLDPSYGQIEIQKQVFVKQLELAERLGKPIQVHSRKASKECFEIIKSFKLKAVLMHWFEDENTLDRINSNGYFVSFGPAILYSKKLNKIASSIEKSLILTESDFPVSFHSLQGVSGPMLIPSVVFKLANILALSFNDTSELIFANTKRYMQTLPSKA
jgi:TatD DNase family protein